MSDPARPFCVYLVNGKRMRFADHYFSTHVSGVLEISESPNFNFVMMLSPAHWTHVKYETGTTEATK